MNLDDIEIEEGNILQARFTKTGHCGYYMVILAGPDRLRLVSLRTGTMWAYHSLSGEPSGSYVEWTKIDRSEVFKKKVENNV